MNKKIKFLALVPSLFMLTGCSYVYKSYKLKIFFFDIALPMFPTIETMFTNMCLSFVQFFNKIYAWLTKIYYETSTNSFSKVVGYLNQITVLPNIIKVSTVLSVASILVFFAISLFKNNMAEQNRDRAPDFISLIKKLFVAFVLTATTSTICISAFIGSSYVGSLVTGIIIKDVGINQHYEIYDEMDRLGISYSTYCEVAQKANQNASPLSSLKKSGKKIELITEETSDALRPSDKFIADNPEYSYLRNGSETDIYNFWCAGGTGNNLVNERNADLNVWASLFVEGQPFADVALFNGTGTDILDILVMVLELLVIMVFTAYTGISIALRVADLLFLILTSWWYIGSSVADLSNRSLSAYIKKIITICLTQFMFAFEVGIFLAFLNSGITTITVKVMLSGAMLLVILSTPTAIADLVQDSGMTNFAISSLKAKK